MLHNIDMQYETCIALTTDKAQFEYAAIIPDEIAATGLPCPAKASYTDSLGLPWCEDCQYRGELLDWGLAHDFPALQATENGKVVYALAADIGSWVFTAVFGSVDCILLLFVAADNYSKQAA